MGIFLQKFLFRLIHKAKVHNKVANTLGRHVALMLTLRNEIFRFDYLNDQYEQDEDFQELWEKLRMKQLIEDYHVYGGFLMYGNQVCILKSSW